MAQKHELAQRDYILGMPYKEIATKYAVSVETVKSWRKRHGWSRDKTTKKGAPIAPLKQQKGCTPKNKGEPEVPEEELSDQELLFCHYYVGRWNATQAAFKAGYASKGNKASAQVIGSRLLARPRVQAELDRLKELLTQEARITAQDVLQLYINIACADIGDYVEFGMFERPMFDAEGVVKVDGEIVYEKVNMVRLNESSMLDTSVISEVKEGRDGISIKLADKMKALEVLRKYFNLLDDSWKQRVEEENLKLSKARLLFDMEKAKGESKGNEHVDALRQKMQERKMKHGSS